MELKERRRKTCREMSAGESGKMEKRGEKRG